ncbi:neuropeptide FF receptor 1-like [Montipora capricornis]|uniref:neuropeptide FF receptor 1-like n=1 Tax=Montipora capricornis TaxID=246305 RepID=UPI0035F1160C
MTVTTMTWASNTTTSANEDKRAMAGSTLLFLRSYDEAKSAFGVILFLLSALIILGIIVNAFICYVMLRKQRYQRNGSNFFILHLSLTELVYRFLVFPVIIWLTVPSSTMTTVQCKTISVFSHTFSSAIFPSLVAIAMDRYQNIIHPLETLKSKRKPIFFVWLIWLYAAIASCPFSACVKSIPIVEIPEARGMSCNDECIGRKICDIDRALPGQMATTLYFLIAFAIPVATIVILYTKVAIFLRQRSRNGMMNKVAARSKAKAVRMLIITVTGYVLSLGPAVVLSMLRSYGIFNNTPFGVMLLVSWSAEFASYASSLGNPLIYAYYNADFRKEIIRLICKRTNKKEVSNDVSMVNVSQH